MLLAYQWRAFEDVHSTTQDPRSIIETKIYFYDLTELSVMRDDLFTYIRLY